MKVMRAFGRNFLKHPILLSLGLVMLLVMIGSMVFCIVQGLYFDDYLVISLVLGFFIIYPIVLTLCNLFFVIRPGRNESERHCEAWLEGCTILLGTVFTIIVFSFEDIILNADWDEVLHNNQIHTPIHNADLPTIVILTLVGIVGYLMLRFCEPQKTPPLTMVLAIAATYVGAVPTILWIVQLSTELENIFYFLFPLNMLLIIGRLIRERIRDWNQMQIKEPIQYRYAWMNRLNERMRCAGSWPLWAFFLFWPMLGILLAVLCLIGQEPDAVIRAWTQTSEWRLSTKISPQNIYENEHYLCTVAAGGHRRIVKPKRKGVRHGHPVIVNRQLCIANAFEQLLAERHPGIHRQLRSFYDTYGFPIAKRIHSPYTADVIYFVMKPLEWLFLGILYLTDVRPENRIAMQYIRPIDTKHS